MWTPIDNYCERIDASLLSEPLNLFSNAAFFVAAFLASRELTQVAPEKQGPFKIMIALCVMVGIGSSLFHSFAVRWAEFADVIPIALFIVFYIGLFFRVILRKTWIQVALAYAGFVAVSAFFSLVIDPQWVNHSQNYFGTLVFLIVLFFSAKKADLPDAKKYLFATLLFAVSLTARSIDMDACDAMSFGTHFLWHTLNGILLYGVMRVAIRAETRISQPTATSR